MAAGQAQLTDLPGGVVTREQTEELTEQGDEQWSR